MLDTDPQKPKKIRKPKEPTEKWLRDQALRYLNRFPATTMKMHQHLQKKAAPNLEFFDVTESNLIGNIDRVIENLVRAGFMNDDEFAASKARVMAKQGKSTAQIGAKLQELGFTETQMDAAIAALGEDPYKRDLRAAARYVKRRKFGPYKPTEIRSDRRDKELASLARQGFSYDIATKALDAETTEDIDALISDFSAS
ncbi:MAG: hypothetical protein COB93_08300 [Sneathiella sp.]|nr:MAG: hypothetical protein COB93_08300 [Sneathiella sp.]